MLDLRYTRGENLKIYKTFVFILLESLKNQYIFILDKPYYTYKRKRGRAVIRVDDRSMCETIMQSNGR